MHRYRRLCIKRVCLTDTSRIRLVWLRELFRLGFRVY
nr:MAG TPA: hypothetical protein [Crassvirales sp.]